MFIDWLVRQFTTFNVLLFVVIVIFNYITTTVSINRQMKEQKLYEELQEIKDEIVREKNSKPPTL
jgi:energy-converting hydrogenase Eha subunit H